MKRRMLLLGAIIASLISAPNAVAAPTIAFLSPSVYPGDTTPSTISDVQDSDGFVHLVAWAKEVPSQALVEFELKPSGQNAASFTADRVGADTWEKFVPIPDSYADAGGYTLTVRLYRGVAGDADEVANDELIVEVNQSEVPPPRGETVELSYPDNGARLGIFVPKGERPVAIFDYAASLGTERVRAFYTLTSPGTAPAWNDSCGASTPDEQGFGKVRCALNEGHNPLDLTAVAVVSNKTSPQSPPNAALDDTGDAHRVLPYLQQPASVEITPGATTVTVAACHLMTALVEDQFGRPVAGANVDIHADGPEDELYFSSAATQTDAFQAPDNQHVSKEDAKRCSDNANSGQQGDHNSPERDDEKHIESAAGTSDNGGFRFALRSDFAGGTFIQAWADVDDDDLPDFSEASGGTQIGWGSPPPPPRLEIFLSPSNTSATNGSCAEFEILARRGGSPHSVANVDIHLSGPEAAVNFCDGVGGDTRRPPESGGHVADAHEDGTRHGEGETNAAGKFTFGITSASRGKTQVQVWLDSNDDDLLNAEPSKTGTVTWAPPGARTISISSSKSSVARGGRVRLSGDVEGDPACSQTQTVKIQSKPVRGGRFGPVRTVTTDAEGAYSTGIKMLRSRKFRAVAPKSGACDPARSRTITVRVGS